MAGRKPITQCTAAEWREVTSQLKACCPAPEGYDWRFIWSRTLGDAATGEYRRKESTATSRGVVYVKVARGLSYCETIDTLMHEMAHAYDVHGHHAWAGHHSDTFWIWVGRIYRRWHGE